LAKDEATRRAWDTDPSINKRLYNLVHPRDTASAWNTFEYSNKYYSHCISLSQPYAYYHRAVPVKGICTQITLLIICKEFLKALLKEECWRLFKNFDNSEDGKENWKEKWATLEQGYVNFSHFVRVKGNESGWSFTKFGIFHAWRRHAAYFMGANFSCIDILIPLAYIDGDGTISLERLALIAISVKNHSGTSNDSVTKDFLNEEIVLGRPNTKGKYVKPDYKSNLLLSLGKLPFICRKEDAATDPVNRMYIEVSEHNPYIAFVMSIGSGDKLQGKHTLVPELQVLKIDNSIDY
jgi:hypothetical protein